MSKNKGLAEQDLSKLDVAQLHPLSPEVISRQATINIGIVFCLSFIEFLCMFKKAKDINITMLYISGTIGHVAHGKSTIVKAISGVHTVKFKSELERNITIKLGYANAKIYKCDKCSRPVCYK